MRVARWRATTSSIFFFYVSRGLFLHGYLCGLWGENYFIPIINIGHNFEDMYFCESTSAFFPNSATWCPSWR